VKLARETFLLTGGMTAADEALLRDYAQRHGLTAPVAG
jgi:hypothetical protein